MTMQAYQFDLRPRDSFEVIRHFELSQAHLEILNRLYAPLIGTCHWFIPLFKSVCI